MCSLPLLSEMKLVINERNNTAVFLDGSDRVIFFDIEAANSAVEEEKNIILRTPDAQRLDFSTMVRSFIHYDKANQSIVDDLVANLDKPMAEIKIEAPFGNDFYYFPNDFPNEGAFQPLDKNLTLRQYLFSALPEMWNQCDKTDDSLAYIPLPAARYDDEVLEFYEGLFKQWTGPL